MTVLTAGGGGVAPFTGAWIEILKMATILRVRIVAPFTGAWIEIMNCSGSLSATPVAPFTGAWIEIACQSSRRC